MAEILEYYFWINEHLLKNNYYYRDRYIIASSIVADT